MTDQLRWVIASAQRQGSELQGGNPSVCRLRQCVDVASVERESSEIDEK
jgi:hypothetical protein